MLLVPERICMRCFSQLKDPKGICTHCGCNNATVANEPHQLECGTILAGAYLVGCALGQGGFGITYVGWDLNLDMKVAIKEFYPQGCVTRDVNTRVTVRTYSGAQAEFFQKGKDSFVEEARALARFSKESCIVGVRGFFHENDTAYIVMDFIEGETLKSYVAQRGGKLPVSEVLTLFRPMLLALEQVHAHGLLHRDISPDNIMIRPDGTLVLLDFGSARQTSALEKHTKTVNIKRGFAPEEQYRAHGEQGPWTDVYAVCATIYFLTTGATPPESLDRLANVSRLIPPTRLGAHFSPAQEAAVLHGIRVRADKRTRDIRMLMSELYEGAPVSAPLVPAKHLRCGIIVASVALFATVCVALGVLFSSDSRKQSDGALNATSVVATLKPAAQKEQTALPTAEQNADNQAVPAPDVVRSPTPACIQLNQRILAAGADFTIALSSDYTVVRIGGSGVHPQDWRDIVQLCAFEFTAAGLRSDGTVVVTGENSGIFKDVENWTDIVQIECGYLYIIGLSSSGQVCFAGADKLNRSSCVGWSDIGVLIGGAEHLAGIKKDGTVVAAGYNNGGQCDTASLRNVVSGDIGGQSTFCVHTDGTVSALGVSLEGEDDVEDWTNIVAVSSAGGHTVGLRADGTVVAAGSNKYGECNVQDWTDIVAVAAGGRHTVGVRSDGTLVATGSNSNGQCNVSGIRLW